MASELDAAHRHGDVQDIPEGVRVVHMTDTLALRMANTLRELADDVEYQQEQICGQACGCKA